MGMQLQRKRGLSLEKMDKAERRAERDCYSIHQRNSAPFCLPSLGQRIGHLEELAQPGTTLQLHCAHEDAVVERAGYVKGRKTLAMGEHQVSQRRFRGEGHVELYKCMSSDAAFHGDEASLKDRASLRT